MRQFVVPLIDRLASRLRAPDRAHRSRIPGTCTVAILALAIAACSGDDAGPTDPPETTEATVSGQVSDRGTGAAISGATVTGSDADAGDELFDVTTDGEGTYEATIEVSDVPGEILVEVDAEKFLPHEVSESFSETMNVDLPLGWADPSIADEDCIPVDPENVEIEEWAEGWAVVDGGSSLVLFEEFESAKDARDLIQFHGLTEYCFVERPNPPMEYWLVGRSPPRADLAPPVDSDDCITVDSENVEIEEQNEEWEVRDGASTLMIFEELASAEDARELIRFYEFTRYCFVERPDPPMQYWLR